MQTAALPGVCGHQFNPRKNLAKMVNIEDIHPLLREMASEGEIDRHHKAAFLDAAQRPRHQPGFTKELRLA